MKNLIDSIVKNIREYDMEKVNDITGNLTIEEKKDIQGILFKEYDIEVKICNQCGEIFIYGFCVHGGENFYCSDECLHKNYSVEEWNKMCAYLINEEERNEEEERWFNEYGDTESYYSEWY